MTSFRHVCLKDIFMESIKHFLDMLYGYITVLNYITIVVKNKTDNRSKSVLSKIYNSWH